jgi:hypothetical protein
MPAYSYVGKSPEHIVGVPEGDITEEEYDALPWELQQAVLINKGSDGQVLYVEKPAEADTPVAAEPESVPDPAPAAAEPDLNLPLDEPADQPAG